MRHASQIIFRRISSRSGHISPRSYASPRHHLYFTHAIISPFDAQADAEIIADTLFSGREFQSRFKSPTRGRRHEFAGYIDRPLDNFEPL